MSQFKVLFTVAEDEKLVECVSKFPNIYDLSSPLYKNQTVKDNAWKEIGEFVERSVDDCRKRWRNIKDTYHKRQKKGKGTGSSASSKGKKWPLSDMLTFLKKVDIKRESISNIQYKENDGEGSDDSMLPDTHGTDTQSTAECSNIKQNPLQNIEETPLSKPRSKRSCHNDKVIEMLESRRIERQKIIDKLTEEKSNDAVDLFFQSIACSLKKLRPDLINEAKLKSLQMVIDLESRNCSTFSNYQRDSASTSSASSSPALALMDNTIIPSKDQSQELVKVCLLSTTGHLISTT